MPLPTNGASFPELKEAVSNCGIVPVPQGEEPPDSRFATNLGFSNIPHCIQRLSEFQHSKATATVPTLGCQVRPLQRWDPASPSPQHTSVQQSLLLAADKPVNRVE